MPLPSEARLSFERTNAPPLPGLTCWNSRILKTVPSTSMWLPFLNWLVLITGGAGKARHGAPDDVGGGGRAGDEAEERAEVAGRGEAGDVEAGDARLEVRVEDGE